LTHLPVCEIQYLLEFDSDVVDGTELEKSKSAREGDQRSYGVTYRLLGGKISGSSPRNSKAPLIESVRGSLAR
jgi:hypothetical protein